MAEEETQLAVVKHENIYAALSAFQGENPKILKTKRFGNEGDKMSFMYADLEDIFDVIRPLLARHGLAIVIEGSGEKLCAALYHAAHAWESVGSAVVKTTHPDGRVEETTTPLFREIGVLRSLPIEVVRKGEKRAVGTDSTYARKYMIAELLGLAPDDDMDAGEEARQKQLESFAYSQAKSGIDRAANLEEVERQITFFKAEQHLAELLEKDMMPKEGVAVENMKGEIVTRKTPLLGLDAAHCKSLVAYAKSRKEEFEGISQVPTEKVAEGVDEPVKE